MVELQIATATDATLNLDLPRLVASDRTPSARPTVQLMWNGEPLGDAVYPLGSGALQVPIAAGDQRIGPNRLVLKPQVPADRSEPFELSCREISLRTPVAPQPVFVRGTAAMQARGSVMTAYLTLPHRARLVGKGIVRLAAPRSRRDRVTVHLIDGSGSQRTLASIPIDTGTDAEAQIDVDLSEFGGQMVALSISYNAEQIDPTHSGSQRRLDWAELRIDSVVEPTPNHATRSVARDRYNIFVILLDSLRADHVEPYGATHVQTPRLRQLAEQGVTFLEARSNSSWTRPAVASMLTSLSASSHGIYTMNDRLAPRIRTLPGMLKRLGYHTLAVTSNAIVSRAFGLSRGFDTMHSHYSAVSTEWADENPTPEGRAQYVWQTYIEPALVAHPDQPFMVYLHEMDPHSPFEAGAPWNQLYTDHERPDLILDRATIRHIRDNPDTTHPEDIRYFNAQYRSEITFMDRYVGWMIDRLEQANLSERTLFVLVSDHGEEFMEHHSVGHGHALHEELLRVPMILRLPGVLAEGYQSHADAQLLDLPPTVFDLIGAPIPDWMEGASLLPFLTGEPSQPSGSIGSRDAPIRRPSYAQSMGPRHSSVRVGPWKLIVKHAEDKGGLEDHQLFHLSRDPQELRNIWADELVVGHTLDQLLRKKFAKPPRRRARKSPPAPRVPLEDGEIQNLRALGYIE